MDLAEEDVGDKMIYRFLDNQLVLAPWSEDFVKKVEFDHNGATRYWPAGQNEAVVIDPKRSFGATPRFRPLIEPLAQPDCRAALDHIEQLT